MGMVRRQFLLGAAGAPSVEMRPWAALVAPAQTHGGGGSQSRRSRRAN